jgi:hypothetical protein
MSNPEIEQKMAEYKKKHPDWQKQLLHVIYPD